jgi:hypothetical protein
MLEATEEWQKGPASVQKGSDAIYNIILQALESNKGALIGRHGTIELTTLLQRKNIQPEILTTLQRNAGIFPIDQTSVMSWISEYSNATSNADAMAAGWYYPLSQAELSLINIIAPHSTKIPLRSLEPYYTSPPSEPWTRVLEGQHVAVVSSFAESMKKQIAFKDTIWPNKPSSPLPANTQWTFIRSYYSPALASNIKSTNWPEPIRSWKDAVQHLETQVVESGARICLLGCGGLAMPLALRLKKRGIVAIVLGGSIQILFGIKGRRWESHPIISKFFNDAWVYPDLEEIPQNARLIEGGCYW